MACCDIVQSRKLLHTGRGEKKNAGRHLVAKELMEWRIKR
jgi:hypothetical protein